LPDAGPARPFAVQERNPNLLGGSHPDTLGDQKAAESHLAHPAEAPHSADVRESPAEKEQKNVNPKFAFCKSSSGLWELVYHGQVIYRQWWNQSPEQFLIEIVQEHIRKIS
jgi:hypothetical protein